MKQRSKGTVILLSILVGFVLLSPPALLRPLFDPDEGRYAEVARETLVEGRWLIPHMNGVPHLTKPPLFYNAVAVSFALLGQHAFALRLVSIIFFLGTLVACMIWIYPYQGIRGMALAAGIHLTMLQPVGAGQFGDLNIAFTFFITSGLLLLYEGLKDERYRFSWYSGWVVLGLGFFTKGPPLFIFLIGSIFVFRLLRGAKYCRTTLEWVGGIAVFLCIALPWYLWILFQEGHQLREFWMGDIFKRTAVSGGKPLYLFGFYTVVFLGGSSGWAIFILYRAILKTKYIVTEFKNLKYPKAFLKIIRSLPAEEQWVLAWILSGLVVFSVMRAKMMSYIQPVYPAFALLTALYLGRHSIDLRLQVTATKIARASALFVLVITWGISIVWYLGSRNPDIVPSAFISRQNSTIIAHMIQQRRDEGFTLVQAYQFSPLYNFVARRKSVLVEEEIHEAWDLPPEYQATQQEILSRIDAGEFMLIVVDSKKLRKLHIDRRAKPVYVLFDGEDEKLLITAVKPQNQ